MNDNRFDIDHNGRNWPHPHVEVSIMEPGIGEHLTAYLTTDQARLYGLQMIREADLAEAESDRVAREEED